MLVQRKILLSRVGAWVDNHRPRRPVEELDMAAKQVRREYLLHRRGLLWKHLQTQWRHLSIHQTCCSLVTMAPTRTHQILPTTTRRSKTSTPRQGLTSGSKTCLTESADTGATTLQEHSLDQSGFSSVKPE